MIVKVFATLLFCLISVTGFSQSADTVETFAMPEIPAEFPGGMSKLVGYVNDTFTSKIMLQKEEATFFRSPLIHWTVDETGKVVDVRILRSTNIPEVDKLFVKAIESMPLWKPAEHGGKNVRQEFRFPVTICFK